MFAKEVYAERRAALKKLMNKGIAFFVANDEASFHTILFHFIFEIVHYDIPSC